MLSSWCLIFTYPPSPKLACSFTKELWMGFVGFAPQSGCARSGVKLVGSWPNVYFGWSYHRNLDESGTVIFDEPGKDYCMQASIITDMDWFFHLPFGRIFLRIRLKTLPILPGGHDAEVKSLAKDIAKAWEFADVPLSSPCTLIDLGPLGPVVWEPSRSNGKSWPTKSERRWRTQKIFRIQGCILSRFSIGRIRYDRMAHYNPWSTHAIRCKNCN